MISPIMAPFLIHFIVSDFGFINERPLNFFDVMILIMGSKVVNAIFFAKISYWLEPNVCPIDDGLSRSALIILNGNPASINTQFQPLGLGLLLVDIGPEADDHGQQNPDQDIIEFTHRTRRSLLQDEIVILEPNLLRAHHQRYRAPVAQSQIELAFWAAGRADGLQDDSGDRIER